MKTIITLCVSSLLLTGCLHVHQEPPSLSSFEGKNVADFLSAYDLNLNDAELVDEPPFILNFVVFRNRPEFGGHTVWVRVLQTDAMFSANRHWPSSLVKRATIAGVSEGETGP
jgi:hypothetical protein